MSKEPFAGGHSWLVERSRRILQDETLAAAPHAEWGAIAEDCVLARIHEIRPLRGLPRHFHPLTRQQRLVRLRELLTYWTTGCPHVIDEQLFADILARRSPASRKTAR